MESSVWLENAQQFGVVRAGKVYRKAFGPHPELEIGVVKETDEAALIYFSKRFDMFEQKVSELETDMAAAENKGSYLNKILHLKETLPAANALGDFLPLLERLDVLEASLRTSIADNRKRNMEHKQAMVAEMEGMIDETDFKALSARLREIRLNWIKTGPVAPDDTEQLTARYEKINAHFYEQRRQYIETRAAQIEERTALYQGIMARLHELKAPGVHPGHIMKTINILTQEWKVVGNIPKEQYEEMKEIFKDEKREIIRIVKKIFRDKEKAAAKAGGDARPRQLTQEEIEQLKNFNLKKALLEEAKGVLEKGDFRGAYPKVKEMQAAWHNVGPIPKTKIFINKDFLYICDRISEFSFLNKMLYQANPYYYRLAPKELAQAKINIMRDIIRKEENDIDLFTQQIREKERSGADMQSQDNKALIGRVNSQGRRLSVKKEILNELRDELEAPVQSAALS
jgi:hypothetical protein